MLRDKNLVPLSRQHQHALALCVRLDRAKPIPSTDLEAWQSEIHAIFANEISVHFDAEERDVFPAAAQFAPLQSLVNELLAEHAELRRIFRLAQQKLLDSAGLQHLGEILAAHIRKEERQLFEQMQSLMQADELARIGPLLERDLAAASCVLPSPSTRPDSPESR